MSLPAEEDRAVEATLMFFAELAGIQTKPMPKIPSACRELAAKCWAKLTWMLETKKVSREERDEIFRECRDFLFSFGYRPAGGGFKLPMAVRRRSYIVGRHFPLSARPYSNPYYGKEAKKDGT